jgi:4-hydroxy-tetrahydrodipicolinate synthase
VIGARSIPGFSVFTGSEQLVDCAMLIGAAGAVPGLCNIAPNRFVELYEACRAGDWSRAVALQERMLGLFEIVSLGNPTLMGISSSAFGGFVTALHLMGIFETNVVAPPLIALQGEDVEAVRRVLEREGLI